MASYLRGIDLARCLRVSRSWRDIFLSHRWRIIRIELGSTAPVGPSDEALYKHRHFLQDLKIYGYLTEFMQYPNLRKLDVALFVNEYMYEQGIRENVQWDLINNYPLLDHLIVSFVNVGPRLCRAISEHSRIRHLRLYATGTKEEDQTIVWEACRNLESLELDRYHFKNGSTSVPKDAVFDRMRKLNFRNIEFVSASEQAELVFHCPRLEILEWRLPDSITAQIMISHPTRKDRWPQVEESSRNPRYLQDIELASVLEGIGNCIGKITDLKLSHTTFGLEACKALGSHFSTLVKLRLDYMSATSSALRDVLCSCPKLESLQAHTILAKDVAEGGPWVCEQLRELITCFRVKQTEQDLQPLVFERLSKMVRLTTLVMGNSFDDGSGDGVLEFRLDCGLGQLANLRELESIGFHRGIKTEQRQRLEMKDVEWMIENWKKLRTVYGKLSRDPEVETQLKGVLKSNGISTSSW